MKGPTEVGGLGFSRLTVREREPTERFLLEGLGMREARTYREGGETARVFEIAGGGPHAEVHLIVSPALQPRRYGSGGVHHVALTVEDEQALAASLERLTDLGYEATGLIDRHYFSSGYVTGPEGVIVEFATTGPGFMVDESFAELGERLSLPPRWEQRRAEIEARLRPLQLLPQPGRSGPDLEGAADAT